MISKQEIMTCAKKLKLIPNTIEKDYVLSWMLAGIANQSNLNKKWVFKGGTCLKKCFFENYRFSEDLDFTLIDKEHINTNFLQNEFVRISEWIYENSGIEMPKKDILFEIYENPRGNLSVKGGISYRGPMQRQSNLPRIKLDLTNDEKIVLEPEFRQIYHSYSDVLYGQNTIQAYCLEEIFAEKLRALTDRLRPRDLYDVINLYQKKHSEVNRENLKKSLRDKCEFKQIKLPTIEAFLENHRSNEMASEWSNMLSHQISDLLPFKHYWQQLPNVLNWVYEESMK